jgi:hypothetical protein
MGVYVAYCMVLSASQLPGFTLAACKGGRREQGTGIYVRSLAAGAATAQGVKDEGHDLADSHGRPRSSTHTFLTVLILGTRVPTITETWPSAVPRHDPHMPCDR